MDQIKIFQTEIFLFYPCLILLTKFNYKLCLLSNGIAYVGQIFIFNVYQISRKGVNFFTGHPVYQECFNEVLCCNFVVAWKLSLLPKHRQRIVSHHDIFYSMLNIVFSYLDVYRYNHF